MPKLLTEYCVFDISNREKLLEERDLNGGKLIVSGVIQRADTVNQNGRIYPRKILEREVENYKKLIAENRAIGQLDHVDDATIELQHVSHIIRDIELKGNVVMGRVEILPTPCGQIARALIESGVTIGISSRAVGSVRKQGDVDEVQDDLQLICWDLVSEPSTPGAFMMKEARDLTPEQLRKVRENLSRTDRIARVVNSILYQGVKNT